ncbi:GntR family transcriptional regulator [Acidisoma cladoniae]|jgi:GntR family transcriptional regulator|uniref:GntR family transcriptional regulator n=1 Tax=Acidisoma cladoniae TaxID=3040935 RepID=UPI00254C26AA|nr:GntR family transcriptional regulator [Acidisoma sp. PAMC 29798]
MSWNSASLIDSPLPLWSQIADRLRAALERGEFIPGDRLPSEADLNEAFGVSRSTARAALDKLESEGRITRRSGIGSIVLPPQVDQPVNLLASFAEDMRARGFMPSYRTRSVEITIATAEVAEALGLETGTPLGMIDRLLLANSVVIGLSHSWLSPAIANVSNLPTRAELDSGSLYRWIEQRSGRRIAGGSEFIQAVNADEQIAASLNVAANAAVLLARRISRTADGQPIEYAMLYYRSDLYRFHIELTRP